MNYNSELENIFQGQLKWDRRRITAILILRFSHLVHINFCDNHKNLYGNFPLF